MSGAAETLKAALKKGGLTLEQLVAMPSREALRLPLIGLKVLAEARRQAIRRGGARAGSGVKPADGATNLVQIGLRIRADQKPKLAQLGGSVWVRRAIDITVAQEPRGNRHGYTGSDYAMDAAVEIEQALSAQGLRSWPADEANAEASARRAAESMIDECDESLRGMLGVEINEEDGFE